MTKRLYDVVRETNESAKELMDKVCELNIYAEKSKISGWTVTFAVDDSLGYPQIDMTLTRESWPAVDEITE